MLSKEELLRSSWMLLTHPDDLEASRRISDRMKAGENGPFILDKRFIRADGNAVWVSLAITVVNTGFEGKRQSLCMTTDISQRKMSEQRILFANTHDSLTMLHNRTSF
jgi:PAS domain S-box-containing protein